MKLSYQTKRKQSQCEGVANEILMVLRNGKKLSNEVSLQETIGYDKEGNEVALIDVLASEDEDIVADLELREQVKKLYKTIQSTLKERERQIIELRYGFADGVCLTQREIASMLGISRSYVSRIEKKTLERLKKQFEAEEG